MSVNPVAPKKLLHSKWTAIHPKNREKHFLVTEVEFDEDQNVISCLMEAVLTHRSFDIDWRDLKDGSLWKSGWQ